MKQQFTFTPVLVSGLFGAVMMLASNVSVAQCPYIPDYTNSYRNATNPNTIVYDNMVSTFHSTMARQEDGAVLVWGENIGRMGNTNVLTPQAINSTNYPGITGDILHFTGGSYNGGSNIPSSNKSQFAVLTTTGLFVWGTPGSLVSTGIASTFSFQKITVAGKTDGLPAGVNPSDVKMLFGSYRLMGIVTCNGDVYTLVNALTYFTDFTANEAAAAYGDGSAATISNNVWHRVKQNATTNLTNAVAIRGAGLYGFTVLKNDGSLWTWGYKTYLGNGSAVALRQYATQMTLPTGVIPKMIGMKGGYNNLDVNYYLLSTTGNVYSMGLNDDRQLGDFTTTNRTSWVQVKKSSAATDYLTNIVWISPIEHDAEYLSAVNALDGSGNLWSWGNNGSSMLGQPVPPYSIDPTKNTGGLSTSENLLAVETGGHTTIVIKKCNNKYGYVGHHINGSMSDGSGTDAEEVNFNFSNTSILNLAGAPSGAATLFPVAGNVYAGQQVQLNVAPAGGSFTVAPVTAGTVNPVTGILTLTGTGTVTVTYNTTSPCPASSAISLNVLTPLPAKILYFDATKQDAVVVLSWATASELNSRGFDIEHSSDGQVWNSIGFIKSIASNGNSHEKLTYTFTDMHPASGRNMYRLKQLDLDGNHEYSSVRILTFNNSTEKGISIYPNPFTDNLNIVGLSGSETIKIYDINGKVIQMLSTNGTDLKTISLSGYSEGVYYLVITAADGSRVTKNILKN